MSDGTPLPNRSEETPVSGRDYPEDDPEGRRWSEIWRAAVEELNANALVSDLSTNRIEYDPEDGTLYVPTDGGNWFIGTGTGWSNLGPIGDIGDHVSDTTNPHSVTAAQADALATTGGTVTGDVTFGEAAVETISGTGPTLSFTADDTRDIHDVTDVTLSNGTAGSITEDVTLKYYRGTDNTETLVASGTQSVTLADGSSTTVQFLTTDFELDNVDYFLEVTTTSLTTDGIEEIIMGASYVTGQTSTGDLVTTDQNSRERVRYDATSGEVSFPAVDADEASVGNDLSFSPAGRPITSNEPQTLNVPADYATIQEALNQIPLFPRHKHVIDIADGDYPEHLIAPEFVSTHYRDGRALGTFMVLLDGNTTTPGSVTVNSITISGACGSGVLVQGLQTTGEIQVDDEGCGIFSGWSDYVNIVDCEIRNASAGLVSYNAHTHVNNIDFGSNSVAGDALWVKKGGKITEQRESGCSGTVGGNAYTAGQGIVFADRTNSTLTGDTALAGGASIVYDGGNQEFLTGPMTFDKRVYLEDTFELPNNVGIMGATTTGGVAQTIIPCNGNDNVEIRGDLAPGGIVDITGSDGIQFRAASGGGFGMRSRVDLSTRTGNYVGEIQCNNGTVNGIGHYEWDGSSWIGIGAEAGQPAITP